MSCNKKQEKGSGVHYAESWFCDENCIFNYIRENNINLEDSNTDDNDQEAMNNQESDGDSLYDPMNDF